MINGRGLFLWALSSLFGLHLTNLEFMSCGGDAAVALGNPHNRRGFSFLIV